MDEDEQDVYVAQLHEVFDSCDHSGKGFLNRSELVELCKKLQLDDQVPQLLQQLLGSEEAEGQVRRKISRVFTDKLRCRGNRYYWRLRGHVFEAYLNSILLIYPVIGTLLLVYAPSDNCINLVYVSAREFSIRQYHSLVDRFVYYNVSGNVSRVVNNRFVYLRNHRSRIKLLHIQDVNFIVDFRFLAFSDSVSSFVIDM